MAGIIRLQRLGWRRPAESEIALFPKQVQRSKLHRYFEPAGKLCHHLS